MSITLRARTAQCPVQLSTLLLKPELADVQISVVGNQKKPTLFHAHKLVLAVASEVFKTMFFGSVPQENPVVVKDSNPAAFEAFLNFVYKGTTTITEADVFPLLYLGKKYMVQSLITVVMNHLERCITSENVGQIVLAGQNFLDDAPQKFWESVESNGEALLQSEEFLQLRKDTVHALVRRGLEVEETFLYDKAVAWAKTECARNQLPVDGETLRNALEGIVEHIRFPTMTAEDFARGPAAEAVLTAEEKVHVFSWFAAAIPQTIFPDTPRYSGEYVCERMTPRFVYTGTATITEAEVFPLLYLGKKYMVRSLVNVVMNHLEGCITTENVGQLVLSGQDFLEDAPPKFWESVESNGEALLKSGEFLQLRKDTMHALVQRELEVEETFLYDKAVAWAQTECARNRLPIDGETLRNALEGVVEHIRFPTMTAADFAEAQQRKRCSPQSWFTADIPQAIFPSTPRYAAEGYVCERLQYDIRDVSGTKEAIDFSVSRALSVTGLGAYGFYDDGYHSSGSIVAKLSLGSIVLAEKELTGTSAYSQTISVNFDKPVKIKANERYTASIVVTGPQTYYGSQGTSSKTVSTKKGGVVFNFVQSGSSTNTSIAQGQIPQIHFRL
ncbi:BTB/POZ domain containing protein [Aphelenchoides avenae]|nr:BTB/POZ domain containing protein [Aphelenchus avenae]